MFALGPWRRLGAGLSLSLLLAGLFLPPAGADAETDSAARAGADRLSFHVLRTELIDTTAVGGDLRDARNQLRVNVLLPQDYKSSPEKKFPVLYLLHGADGGYDDYEREMSISTLYADFPGIVVMPDAGTYGNYADWFQGGDFPTPRWETYLLQELRPWVHRNYRILPGRRWHAIAGLSGGGQGALRLGSDLPGYFGSVVGFSAAMPDMQDLFTYALFAPIMTQKAGEPVTYEDAFGPLDGWYATASNPTTKINQLESSRVYLTWGDGTNCEGDPTTPQELGPAAATEVALAEQNIRYVAALQEAGIDVTDAPTCGVHTWPVWGRALEAAAEWDYFAKVPPAPKTWSFISGLQQGEAWDVKFKQAELPTDTLTLERKKGGVLVAGGAGKATLRVKSCSRTLTLPGRWTIPFRCR